MAALAAAAEDVAAAGELHLPRLEGCAFGVRRAAVPAATGGLYKQYRRGCIGVGSGRKAAPGEAVLTAAAGDELTAAGGVVPAAVEGAAAVAVGRELCQGPLEQQHFR
jgi:hypothetical protein